MHKYLLLLVILYLQITVSQQPPIPRENYLDLYEIESTKEPAKPIKSLLYADPDEPTIVKSNYYSDAEWSEVVAILSNDDVITYTMFHRYKSSICFHAVKQLGNNEIPKNADPYWVSQMETLYKEKTT